MNKCFSKLMILSVVKLFTAEIKVDCIQPDTKLILAIWQDWVDYLVVTGFYLPNFRWKTEKY